MMSNILTDLVEKYLQGTLTEEESCDLLRILESNSEASDDFRDNILVHFALKEKCLHYQKIREDAISDSIKEELRTDQEKLWADFLYWEKSVIPIPPEKTVEVLPKISYSESNRRLASPKAVKQTLFPLIFFLSLLILVIGAAEYHSYYASKKAVEDFVPVQDPFSVVQIKETIDAVWETDKDLLKRGQKLDPCKINLKSGLVKLLFENGVEMVLRGPNEFVVNNSMSTFCMRGELSAFVPPQGKGFEIVTPFASFIDRGTEFSLAVSEKNARLDVIKGNVNVSWSPRLPILNLFAGEGIEVKTEKETTKSSARKDHFISKDLFNVHLTNYQGKIRKEDTERDRFFGQYSSLLTRYRFDGSVLESENLSRGTDPVGSSARLLGAKETESFLPGLKAAALRNKQSSIHFSVPGEYQDLTLMALIRLDRLREYGNVLMISDRFWEEEGSVLWQILRDGRIQIQIKQQNALNESYFNSDPYFLPSMNGTWSFLTVCADSKNRKISFYVDGKFLSATPWKDPFPLKIGDSTIGKIPKDQTITERIMDGAIGELSIFNRVLKEEEIRILSGMKHTNYN